MNFDKYCVQVRWFPQRSPKPYINQNTIFACSNTFFEPDIKGGDCSIHEYYHIEKDQKSLPIVWKKIFDFVWLLFMLFFLDFFLFHPKITSNHHGSTN